MGAILEYKGSKHAKLRKNMQLIIRAAIRDDIEAIQSIYSYYVLNGLASFEITPPDETEMLARWRLVRDLGHPYLVAEFNDTLAGFSYASTFRKRPAYDHTLENAVYVSPEYLEKGIGVCLLNKLIEECIHLGFRQMIAVIGDSNNHPSLSLHTKCGFERVGILPSTGFKHGRWVDTVLMQRSIGDGDKTPPS